MIGTCKLCGKMFDGSDEDTSGPDVMCPDCYRAVAVAQMAAANEHLPPDPYFDELMRRGEFWDDKDPRELA